MHRTDTSDTRIGFANPGLGCLGNRDCLSAEIGQSDCLANGIVVHVFQLIAVVPKDGFYKTRVLREIAVGPTGKTSGSA